jgi:hypothetical protein
MTATAATTIAAADQPRTAVRFLFHEDQDTGQALGRALSDNAVLRPLDTTLGLLSQPLRRAVDHQVASAANGLLDLDFGDLMVAGWRKQGDLAAAARGTAAKPGTHALVELASQRISSQHRPFVDLVLDDVHVATINFQLDIEFLVRALVATVRDGHVVELSVGSCEVAATLAAEGVRLIRRRARFDPLLVIRLPLLLRVSGDADPLPDGAKSPSARSRARRRRLASPPGGRPGGDGPAE